MRVSAKGDYAVRAAIELAATGGEPIKGERIADAQDIPLKFLENILGELKHTGIVASRRGAQGGYWLAKPANEVSLADIVRAVEGPLASVRGQGPETPWGALYPSSAAPRPGFGPPARSAHRLTEDPRRPRPHEHDLALSELE